MISCGLVVGWHGETWQSVVGTTTQVVVDGVQSLSWGGKSSGAAREGNA